MFLYYLFMIANIFPFIAFFALIGFVCWWINSVKWKAKKSIQAHYSPAPQTVRGRMLVPFSIGTMGKMSHYVKFRTDDGEDIYVQCKQFEMNQLSEAADSVGDLTFQSGWLVKYELLQKTDLPDGLDSALSVLMPKKANVQQVQATLLVKAPFQKANGEQCIRLVFAAPDGTRSEFTASEQLCPMPEGSNGILTFDNNRFLRFEAIAHAEVQVIRRKMQRNENGEARYFLTFAMPDGSEQTMEAGPDQYGAAAEGDRCMLTYCGSRCMRFEKLHKVNLKKTEKQYAEL